VPVEAYGQAGAQAGDLHAGDAVLVAGKLQWTSYTDKHGQKRTNLCVLARLVKRLAPVPVEAGV
jgi:single-stranded DNA-binding protein